MATAVDVRVWRRRCEPEEIERELATLWSDIGREQPITRAMMSNLVIARRRPSGTLDLGVAPEGIPLDDVARRHPARILLVYHEPGAPANCPPVGAAVAIRTFGSASARYGIEAISVESRCAETSLPSIVRRLIVGDLPTTIWWMDDLSHTAPLPSLASMARSLLYDSRGWRDPAAGFRAVAGLIAAEAAPAIADLNWRRLTPLRTALASTVRWRDDVIAGTVRAEIHHRAGDGALAQLLAGWIAARMRWPAHEWPLAIREERRGDEVLRLTLDDGRGGSIAAEQNGHRVLVRDESNAAPIALPVPHEATADAVAAELSSVTPDICLRDALLATAARTSG